MLKELKTEFKKVGLKIAIEFFTPLMCVLFHSLSWLALSGRRGFGLLFSTLAYGELEDGFERNEDNNCLYRTEFLQ